jgi:hypothetical protein
MIIVSFFLISNSFVLFPKKDIAGGSSILIEITIDSYLREFGFASLVPLHRQAVSRISTASLSYWFGSQSLVVELSTLVPLGKFGMTPVLAKRAESYRSSVSEFSNIKETAFCASSKSPISSSVSGGKPAISSATDSRNSLTTFLVLLGSFL